MISTKFNIMGITFGPPLSEMYTLTDNGDNTWSIGSKSDVQYPDNLVLPTEYQGKPITKIARSGFDQNNSPKTIEIPSSYKVIGQNAFFRSDKLVGIKLNEGLETIELQAFIMTNISSEIIIPSTVKNIGEAAFAGCSGNIKSNSTAFNDQNGFLIENSTGYLIYAPIGKSGDILFTSDINGVLPRAFGFCHNITSLYFQASSLKLFESSIAYMNNLTSFTADIFDITSTTSELDFASNAFAGVYNLKKVYLEHVDKSFVKNSANYPWGLDLKVTTIHCSDGNLPESEPEPTDPSLFNYVSDGSGGYLISQQDTGSNLPENVVLPNTYEGKKVTGQYYNPNVEWGKQGAFQGNDTMKSCIINKNATSIEKMAFQDCYFLSTVIIPNSVSSIGINSFYNCQLSSLIIPNSVSLIKSYALYGCKNLMFEGKDENTIKGMSDYPWGLSSGTQVSCTNGIFEI